MENLWSLNTTQRFWQCQPNPPEQIWQAAIQKSIHLLGTSVPPDDCQALPAFILGEGQFGPNHWQLNLSKRIYYELKPFLPRQLINLIKKGNSLVPRDFPLSWPIEDRYVKFLWEVIRQVLLLTGEIEISYRQFWPDSCRYALVLTHDIETSDGQTFVRKIAEFEESLGLRSSFNFVPEEYAIDEGLIEDLRARGFEIGVHGLKHDGKLFRSKANFLNRAERINDYIKKFGAVGFRSPLTHRNPEWMQALEIEYDLSFFDTDPYEPMPGGTMSIWPFSIGHFVELPYTLTQDCTLGLVFSESTPRLWMQKLDFIRQYHGMGLLNSHPDYLINPKIFRIYEEFLQYVKAEGEYWNALPRQAASWWRARADNEMTSEDISRQRGILCLEGGQIFLKEETALNPAGPASF